MTERDFWNRKLRPLLHRPSAGRVAYKVQDAFVKGLPDVVTLQNGRTFWIELKVMQQAPVRAGTPWRVGVSPEQSRWLDAWNRAWFSSRPGDEPNDQLPPAFVLLWVQKEKRWYALHPSVPDIVDQSEFQKYVWATGSSIDSLQELFT